MRESGGPLTAATGGAPLTAATGEAPLTLETVQAAAERLRGRIHHTPCWPSQTFSDLCGGQVWLKYENLQRTGSYKIRGALNRILTLPAAARAPGWLALAMASTLSGNLTPIASIANLIVVEAARSEGIEIRLVDYCRVGVPITVATLAVGVLWLTYVP